MLNRIFLTGLLFCSAAAVIGQEVLNKTLLRADKLFIKRQYEEAALGYLSYLEKYPKAYYAERQVALCYNKLNRPDDAIDHWPIVVESSDASESDYLEYGRSLLANNRIPEARKIFAVLAKSQNSSMAAWARTYLNPAALYIDSASVRVREVSGINTELPESSPLIFRDKMYYLSDKVRSPRQLYAQGGEEHMYISGALKKDSLQLFPSVLAGKLHSMPVSGPFCFSPDGATLYFTRMVKVNSQKKVYKYQIYTLTMSTLNNPVPEIKPFRHNSPDYDLMHPCISPDGKRLFFSSDMKGSAGGKDIFVCDWTVNGWTAPRNAGARVNSPGNEVFPFITADNTLYFSSDHLPGLGGLDVFYALPAGEGQFGEAENAGAKINSRFDDFGVFIMNDGNSGYFSSNRKNNTDDDIYYFYKVR
jgi:hypothetical protein